MKLAIALSLSLLSSFAHAAAIGERLNSWTLNDQFEQGYTLQDETRTLLVARNMDGAKLVKAALEDRPKGYLESREVVFVADVQRMPALISKLFAIPAMRDYNYRVLLDRDGKVAAAYPGAEGSVLWMQLDKGVLVSQQEFVNAADLRAALEKAEAR